MTVMTKPDFKLPTPNTRAYTTDALWAFRCWCLALESSTRDAGTYANKSGFHNTGAANKANWPNNYSIRDKVNQSGPGWDNSSAFDWTFTTAQHGDYTLIDRYTSRLVRSALDAGDPRLDLVLFEFYGQADSDLHVEGYNEFREEEVTSGPRHLWHIHLSLLRSKVGDFWAMWALYTVLIGWSVAQWRASLPSAPSPVKPPKPPVSGLPKYRPGSRVLRYTKQSAHLMVGTDVQLIQTWIGERHCGKADGRYGPKTAAGVEWYQRMRGIRPYDGIAGPRTWAPILRTL